MSNSNTNSSALINDHQIGSFGNYPVSYTHLRAHET